MDEKILPEKLPEKILEIDEQVLSIENQLYDTCELILAIEVPVRIDISNELGVGGKPKFSNEERRSDEFYIRTKANKEYVDLVSRKKKLLGDRDFLRIKKDYFENLLLVLYGDKKHENRAFRM